MNVIIRKKGQPYSVYLLSTSFCLFAAAIEGLIIEYVRFYGFYSPFLDIFQECLKNLFSYAALFFALKFTIEITHGDWKKIKLAPFFLLITYAVLFSSYTLYRLYNELFFFLYFLFRVVFWEYYFFLIVLQFHQYANKLTDDVVLRFRLRLIEVGSVISMFYPFLAVQDITWRLSLINALIAAVPYYIAYSIPKWLERKIVLKNSKEDILDRSLFLIGILSEHYTEAIYSKKSLLVDYVKAFGKFLRLSDDDIKILVKASYLLDVGSMEFGQKSDDMPSTVEEAVSSNVSANFAKILLETEHLADIILHHHDRWDGRGRFNKASGEEIPFGSRIIAILDCFVSALSEGRDELTALEEIREKAETFFDPRLVELFSEFLSLKDGENNKKC